MRGRSTSKTTTNAGAKMAKLIYQCTACKAKIRTTFEANLHPLIGTLICRNCKDTYGNGDFAKNWEDGVDEEGDDNYCRWCCDGGNLFGCMNIFNENIPDDRCHYSFCSDCITHNVPDDFILKSVEKNDGNLEEKSHEQPSEKSNGNSKAIQTNGQSEENLAEKKWLCYACDRTKLAVLRKYAKEAIEELSERAKKRTAANQGPPANQKKKRKTENGLPSSVTTSRAQKASSSSSKESAAPKESTNSKETSTSKEINLAETIFAPPGLSLVPKSRLQGANTASKQDSDKSANTSITKNSQNTKDAQVTKKPVQEHPSLTKNQQKAGLAQTKDAIKVTEAIPAKKTSTPGVPTTEQATSSDKDKSFSAKEGPVLASSNPLPLIKLSSVKEPVAARQSTLAAAKAVANTLIAPVRPRPMSSSFTIVSRNQTTTKQHNTTMNSSRVLDSQLQNNRDLTLTERQVSNQQVKKPEIVQPISEVEMKKRLQTYSTTKDTCIEEVNCRFTNLVQMLNSNDSKSKKVSDILINEEISGLKKAMKEFDLMLLDIQKLSRSSNR